MDLSDVYDTVIKKSVSAFNSRNFDGLDKIFDENVEFTALDRNTGNIEPYQGLDKLEYSFKLLIQLFPDIQLKLDRQIIKNNEVWTFGNYIGTHMDKPYKIQLMGINEFRDGKIVYIHLLLDTMRFFRMFSRVIIEQNDVRLIENYLNMIFESDMLQKIKHTLK